MRGPKNATGYDVTERLRNGAPLHIRALVPDDRTEMLVAVGRFSKPVVSPGGQTKAAIGTSS
jgi:hypothetical protein